MALSVITNISSLNAQRNLQKSTFQLNKSLERLSSGLRINRAGDDAAGLAISEGLESQIRGLNQSVRNAGDGLSLIGTAESAIDNYTGMLQRVRELAIQSANDTNSAANRAALNQEVGALLEEMQRLSSTIEFNGTKLLDGSFVNKQLQVGSQANQTITISTGNLQTNSVGQIATAASTAATLAADFTDSDLSINNVAITNIANYQDSVSSTLPQRSAITLAAAINAKTAEHGVTANVGPATFTGAATIASAFTVNPSGTPATNLQINGVDIFDVSTAVDNNAELAQIVNTKSNQTGVTASVDGAGKLVLQTEDGRNLQVKTTGGQTIADGLGLMATDVDIDTTVGGTLMLKSGRNIVVDGDAPGKAGLTAQTYSKNPNTAINTVSISTVAGANLAIQQVDSALEQVNEMRAGLGAMTNRLDQTISSLQSIAENLSASQSRIRDADFAAETAQLTKNQILQQAGVSILSQANTTPQAALSLLQR